MFQWPFSCTTLGLDLLPGTYCNTFLWYQVTENDTIQVVHQILCLKMEPEPASEMLCCFKKLDDSQSPPKIRLCQLTSVFWVFWPWKMGPVSYPETSVRSIHSRLHKVSEQCRSYKTVWRWMPWFGASYVNLRHLTNLSANFKNKPRLAFE
jgi:hypothetical protein